jgi:hypothetical protein
MMINKLRRVKSDSDPDVIEVLQNKSIAVSARETVCKTAVVLSESAGCRLQNVKRGRAVVACNRRGLGKSGWETKNKTNNTAVLSSPCLTAALIQLAAAPIRMSV